VPDAEFLGSGWFHLCEQPLVQTTGQDVFFESRTSVKVRLVLGIEGGFCGASALGIRVPVVILKAGLRERRRDAVIVLVTDRIELVVMATGTADRQTKH
jgi:hypothetical protein